MKQYFYTILVGATLGVSFTSAESNCSSIGEQITKEVANDSAPLYEAFSKNVEIHSTCVCEILKATIINSDLTNVQIASLVEIAITSLPDQISLIAQCAIAVAPDAVNEIQAVVAKLDSNSGDSVESSKDGGKGADKEKESWNPLDFPGDEKSEVGPRTGTGGGSSSLMPGFVFDAPPIVDSPEDTTIPNPQSVSSR